MKIEYSKEFEKAAKKLAGKRLNSLKVVVLEVKKAKNIKELTDCKKLAGYENAYRLRIGGLRAFFLFRTEGDSVEFEYLVSCGEAYSKKIEQVIPYAINWQIKENVYINKVETKTDMSKIADIIKRSTYRGFIPIETLGKGDPKEKVTAFYKVVKEAVREIL